MIMCKNGKRFFRRSCTKRRLIFYYKGAYAAPLYPRRRVRPGAILRWCVNVGGCVVFSYFFGGMFDCSSPFFRE